jgi:hypothetical protein
MANLEDDFTDWVDSLPLARTKVAMERAARICPHQVDFDEQGAPITSSHPDNLIVDDEGHVIPGVANDDNFYYLLFQEYQKMYLDEIMTSLARRGLVQTKVQEDGGLGYKLDERTYQAVKEVI